ncbi:MAG: hypothetical protein KDI98_05070, partial [Hyphomicrobiaceae bacterium]|nr:hypothetical protein [Hyphomicrobiaceae bacterium]
GGAVWLMAGALSPAGAGRPGSALVAAPLLVQAVNGFALPLTGMEHPLHVAASVAILVGLAQSARDGRAPGWLFAALLLAPAIRFEGYALALAATLALAAMGRWRMALAALVGLLALTAGYVGTMISLDLPLLPSSVMVKSQTAAAAMQADGQGALTALAVNAILGLRTLQGMLLAALAALLALLALVRPNRARNAVVWPALAAIVAHLLVGRFGWFGRYEVYAVALAITAYLLQLRRPAVAPLALLAVFGWSYAATLSQTPAAAQSIDEQQHQMHRFSAQFFPEPVAVNDLGWVAWRNDTPVLDLWGLGSEQARRLTAEQGRTVETVRSLTAGRATYAMIYDIAFEGAIPPEWCRVATLTTSRVIAASDTVSFWLIDRPREGDLRAALDRFAPTLPPGATLRQHPCES